MHTRDNSRVVNYITETFVHEPDWLLAPRQTGDTQRPGMQVSSHEGHLLCWLAKLTGATDILEIGTFMGYSGLWMASSGARVTSLEFSGAYAELARKHISESPHAERMLVEQGDALAWLATQPQTPRFDMLFIDAEKRSYVKYLESALPLLKPGALIVGDNSLLWGAVTGESPEAASPEATQAMRKFNTLLADPARFDAVMLPTIEGLTVARMKV